ncbi:MAG TPA: hypothetical protein VEC19_12120 [Usitatibacter sp.]|nr:hypothetical protein [Usitatibacter sp.]
MKKTDLEKLKGKKIAGSGFGGGTGDRFGRGAATPGDRREQREREREAGLVPFAVKLHGDLVKQVHDLARERGTGLNEVTAELIRKGLAAK